MCLIKHLPADAVMDMNPCSCVRQTQASMTVKMNLCMLFKNHCTIQVNETYSDSYALQLFLYSRVCQTVDQ